MLNKELKNLIFILKEEKLDVNNILLFLLNIREDLNINVELSDEEHMFLFKNKIIIKNYITNSLNLNIPFYEDDDGNKLIYNVKNIKEEVNERVNDFRKLFLGIRPGSIGVRKEVVDKLVQFMFYHPEITFDKILNATNHYISTTDLNYVMNADNFIMNEKNISKLFIVIEEIDLGGNIKSNLL